MSQDRVQDVLETVGRAGVAAAAAELLSLPPRDLVTVCRDVVLELLQTRRDVTSGLLLGWAGAIRAERLAREAPTIHRLDREFLEHARSLYATLGSLLWPGWGRDRLRLDASARRVGRICAERAGELAEELAAEPLVRAKARWLIAVHALFADDLEASRSDLIAAGRLAEEAGADDEVKLLQGYLLLVQSRSEPDDPEIGYEIDRICAEFESDAATAGFAGQLRTARAALDGVGDASSGGVPREASARMT